MITVETARETARGMLSAERFFHTECVAAKAVELALRYGANAAEAETAALLHDIAKEMPREDLLQMIRRSDIIDVDELLGCEPVWHAYAGGIYAKETLGAGDRVADAISCHTAAKAGMSVLEKIIFLADCVSSDRDFKDIETARALSERSLDGAVLFCLCSQAEHLIKRRRRIDLNMVRAYNDLAGQGG